MKTIKNKIKVQNLDKFSKMSLLEFESKSEKHKLELGGNYEYLHAIKSGNISKYTNKKDLETLKKLSEYFFGTIPVRTQNNLLKAYSKTLLKLPHGDFLDEYVRYLNALIYIEQNL